MNKEDEYTQIESIRDLQKNLRIDSLNKRFVDKEGNRYVVRFSKESRKPEIFKIQTKMDLVQKTSNSTEKLPTENGITNMGDMISEEESTQKSKNKIRESDKANLESMFPKEDDDEFTDIDLNIENTVSPEKKAFDNSLANPISMQDEKRYIFDLLKCINKNKERILSTLSNIKSSRIFELTGDPSENKNIISNFTREFETEIFRIIENFDNKFKEISAFPKSINHYSMGYTLAQNDFLNTLENDKLRLEYILHWEMQEPNLLLVKKFAKMVTSLLGVLNTKEEEQIKSLNFQQQTLFRDSKSAALYCLNDLDFLKRSIENWIQSAV